MRNTDATKRAIPSSRRSVIQSHRQQPRGVWMSKPELIDGKRQFLILVARPPAHAVRRKACDEHKRITRNGLTDLELPVTARPKLRVDVTPDRNSRSLQHLLEPIDSC